MLRFAAILSLFIGLSAFTSVQADKLDSTSSQQIILDGNHPIHPSVVNRVIRTAATHWGVSVSVLRKEYNDGVLIIDENIYPTLGLAYDVTSPSQGGVCILAIDLL